MNSLSKKNSIYTLFIIITQNTYKYIPYNESQKHRVYTEFFQMENE